MGGVARRVVGLAEEVFAVAALRVAVFAHAARHQIHGEVSESIIVCHLHPSRAVIISARGARGSKKENPETAKASGFVMVAASGFEPLTDRV